MTMQLVAGRDLGWLAYWGLVQSLRVFPPAYRLKHSLRLARLCASIWLALSPGERAQTLQNLQSMYRGQPIQPDLERVNLEHHAAHVWAFLAPDVLPSLSWDQIRQLGEVRGREHLDAALAQGRGAVLLSAHYGSHGYLVIAVLAAHGIPVTAVAGREGIPVGKDEPEGSWLYRKVIHPERERPRQRLPFLTKGLVPDPQITALLRENKVLWIQGDMHLTAEDVAREKQIVEVPFLWGRAPFRTGPVRLPKLFKAPLLPCFGVRRGAQIDVEIEPPLQLCPGMRPEEIATDLRAYLDRLEPRILAHPEQWGFTRHPNLPAWIKEN
jgi:lauroyl/myristoyl acyltransferase